MYGGLDVIRLNGGVMVPPAGKLVSRKFARVVLKVFCCSATSERAGIPHNCALSLAREMAYGDESTP